MYLNERKMTIVLTQEEAKNARVYGTADYVALRKMKKDNPGYREEVKKVKRNDGMRGLTYDRMKAYIEKHDFNDHSIMKKFEEFAYGKIDGEVCVDPASYGETKKWFLIQFPEFETFRSYERIEAPAASKLEIIQMPRKAANE